MLHRGIGIKFCAMSEVSIAALQAYRSVARCGSFTAAADDLGCSQSAVSRHIAALERHLKQPLLYRGHRRIQLTAAGEVYLESVIKSLDELEQGAVRIARKNGVAPKVRILAMPSFASRWLIPRLNHPSITGLDVEIELLTSIWDTDYRKERFDLAIHYGDGAWPGARLLIRDHLIPVASPALLRQLNPESVSALSRALWLHDTLRPTKWTQWLAVANAVGTTSARNLKLQDTDATLVAAMAGLGITIGHDALVEHDVREGRLAIAWPCSAPLAAGYHLLQSKRGLNNLTSRLIADWLVDEAASFNSHRNSWC